MTLSVRDVYDALHAYLAEQSCAGTLHSLQRTVLSKGLRRFEEDAHWPILDFPLAIHRHLQGDRTSGLGVAAACALFYGFADVTDEAQDHELSAAPWATWGWEQAVNTGTSLLFLSQHCLHAFLPEALASQVSAIFVRAGLAMTYGQHADLGANTLLTTTLQDYLQAVERKSGASFGAYAEAMALACGAECPSEYGDLGRALGAMFQMISDWHELCGASLSSDLVNRRASFPYVLALEQLPSAQRSGLEALLALPATLEVQRAIAELLDREGIRGYASLRCEVYRRRAKQLAERLDLATDPYVSRLIAYPTFPQTAVAI